MTDEERRAVRILIRCRFLPASWDKQFVRDMADKLKAELDHVENTYTLSEKQHACLMEKLHRYRKQHERCGCLKCLRDSMGRGYNPHQLVMFEEKEALAK